MNDAKDKKLGNKSFKGHFLSSQLALVGWALEGPIKLNLTPKKVL